MQILFTQQFCYCRRVFAEAECAVLAESYLVLAQAINDCLFWNSHISGRVTTMPNAVCWFMQVYYIQSQFAAKERRGVV